MTKTSPLDIALCILLLIACLFYLFAPALGLAQARRRLAPAERALALQLARVSFNEALDSEADLAMIWQTVQASGELPSGRLAWLARHSPCVAGAMTQDQAYQRPGNCRWTRNLTPDARRPRGWDRARDGAWTRIRPRWQEHLRRAVRYVREDRGPVVCPVAPRSWDGRRYGRDTIEARGFAVLDCKGDLRNYAVVREPLSA